MATDLVPGDYERLLTELKRSIREARQRAILAANREMVLLYWRIGREILARQSAEGWGAKIIQRLSRDLRAEFPEMKGLSPRNLAYMRRFAEAYPDEAIVQQLVAQLPWGHNVRILDAASTPSEREFYLRAAIEHGWSRNVLVHQIESGLHLRIGQAVTNFEVTLPAPQSDLALQTVRDPYVFDFLSVGPDADERALERALVERIRDFLLELGTGFAYVGSQYHLEVGGEDFYVDLLFYHLKLRCYVVIELKVGPFQPEHAGKLNFYLSAVDDLLRTDGDQPSIGLVLCRSRNRVVAEYSLRDMRKALGVATYELLPSPERLEAELGRVPLAGPKDE